MASREGDGGPGIGETLEAARLDQGLELRAAEERTKIRLKYLRALESEDWDALPGPAYAIGFLRTYAELLRLDADALVDELRRRLEGEAPTEQRYPLGEPVLKGRRRDGGRRVGSRVAMVTFGLVLVVLAAVVLAGLLSDDDDGPVSPAKDKRDAGGEGGPGRSDANSSSQQESGGTVALHLILRDDVPVCLIGDGSQPLVDNQVLNAGSEEEFEGKRFELRFPEGFNRSQVELELDGERVRLEDPQGPAAFAITGPDRVKPAEIRGADCP